MVELYTNPLNKNDTNEANLVRVMNDSALEDDIEVMLDQYIGAHSEEVIAVIQMDMDKSVEIRKSGIDYKLQVLKEVGNLLNTYASKDCIVMPHGSRDDVTLIRFSVSAPEEEMRFVREVLKKIETTPFGHGMDKEPFYVTYSAGIAFYPAHGRKASQLLQLADGAIRVAKDNGRNSYEIAENGFYYEHSGKINSDRWNRLFKISCETGKTMDELIREGYEELFQKHAAFYRFCCQEKE